MGIDDDSAQVHPHVARRAGDVVAIKQQAADLDFGLAVLRDGCGDVDPKAACRRGRT